MEATASPCTGTTTHHNSTMTHMSTANTLSELETLHMPQTGPQAATEPWGSERRHVGMVSGLSPHLSTGGSKWTTSAQLSGSGRQMDAPEFTTEINGKL
ncbi:uncharacterized protein V6R79_011179 [Siganus canaliculatus]